jgi:Zn-dependent oligopeptidase
VLQRFLRHPRTQQPPPEGLLVSALHSNELDQRGLRLQQQLLYAAADQALFGPQAAERFAASDASSHHVFMHAMDMICAAQEQLTVLPVARIDPRDELLQRLAIQLPGELQQSVPTGNSAFSLPAMNVFAHTHFVNYGGSYYSYLLAKAYAAQIYARLFAADPLNRSAGEHLRRHFLAFGASRAPLQLLEDVAGELDVAHFLNSLTK